MPRTPVIIYAMMGASITARTMRRQREKRGRVVTDDDEFRFFNREAMKRLKTSRSREQADKDLEKVLRKLVDE